MSSDNQYVGKTAYRGEIAANYDRDRVHEPIWDREQAWVEAWAERIKPGASVLDVPAGTGRFVGILSARGALVHAVDVSEDMLTELRRQWPDENKRLFVTRADAEALPYADGTFDFALCWRLFHLLPPPAAGRVLRELARVCRGEIVVEVLNVAPAGFWRTIGRAVKSRLRDWLGWQRPADSAGAAMPWGHITNYPHTEKSLRDLFDEIGVRIVAVETLAADRGALARVYRLEHGGSR